jgi:hypothetical protein
LYTICARAHRGRQTNLWHPLSRAATPEPWPTL